jgi:hypothetical protein
MLYEDRYMKADRARRANFSAAENDQEGTAADPPTSAKGRVAGARLFAVIMVAGVTMMWSAFLLWLFIRVLF